MARKVLWTPGMFPWFTWRWGRGQSEVSVSAHTLPHGPRCAMQGPGPPCWEAGDPAGGGGRVPGPKERHPRLVAEAPEDGPRDEAGPRGLGGSSPGQGPGPGPRGAAARAAERRRTSRPRGAARPPAARTCSRRFCQRPHGLSPRTSFSSSLPSSRPRPGRGAGSEVAMARRAQAAALPLRPALAPRPDAEPGSPTAAPPEPPPRAAAGADLPRRGPGRRRARRGAARAPHPSRAGALRSGPRPEAPPTRRGPAQPLRALRAAGSPGPPATPGAWPQGFRLRNLPRQPLEPRALPAPLRHHGPHSRPRTAVRCLGASGRGGAAA